MARDAEGRIVHVLDPLQPLEPVLAAFDEVGSFSGAARLLNGNPGTAMALGRLDWGAEAWASHDGRPVAIGTWRGGDLHPARVFRLDD